MNFDDYESLPTTSIVTNMTAGAIAGVLEHCLMYPLDSVKTRMQSLSPKTSGHSIIMTFTNMVKKEGLFRPIRGVGAVVAGAGPAHAFYFGTYEFTKEFLTKYTKHNQLNYITSAVAATLIHDAISNPAEVIKQRLQMYNSPYNSVIQCLKGVYQTEGIRAFYRSYTTQLTMNLPFQSIHFMTYEFFQNMLNNERKYNPPVHVVAGGAAGAAASALTTPLDVVKTLLNTQETGFTKGMKDAIRQIYTMAGPLGFFKGLGARVLYSIPAAAICWSTYEFFKFYLSRRSRDDYKSSISGKSLLQPKDILIKPPSGDGKKIHYVLPDTSNVSTTNRNDDKSGLLLHDNIIISDTSANINNNNSNSSNSSSGNPSNTGTSIKSVCDISSSVSGEGIYTSLNLNTVHTDVKTPYERRYSGQ